MAFQFVIDISANVIRETWSGKVDLYQLYESCQLEWADPQYRKQMSLLSDFRSAQLEVTQEGLRRFADFIGQQEAVRRHAIVVSRHVGLSMARMFNSLSEVNLPYWQSLRVFFDIQEAERWVLADADFSRTSSHWTGGSS